MMLFLLACSGVPTSGANARSESWRMVVTTHTIAAGSAITEADVSVGEVDPRVAPATSRFTDLADVLGRVAKEEILAGEPVRAERLASAAAPTAPSLHDAFGPGALAVTVPVGTEEGWSASWRPGQSLDVIWTPDRARAAPLAFAGDRPTVERDACLPDADVPPGARTVLQSVEILAVDAEVSVSALASRGDTYQGRLTLGLTPRESERLLLARASGAVRYGLRAATDTAILTDGAAVDRAALRGE